MRQWKTVIALAIGMYIVKISAKLGAGLHTDSEMLIGDGLHNVADLVEILLIVIALKLARRPENHRFPLGYMNIESLGSLAIGILIALVAFHMGTVTIAGIISHVWGSATLDPLQPFLEYKPLATELETLPLLLGVTFGSVLISIAVGRYEIKTGKRTKSELLVDDGRETITDAWIEGSMFGAIILNFITDSTVPELGVIALLTWKLGKTSYEIITPALGTLLLRSLPQAHEREIRSVAESFSGISLDKLRTTQVGRHMAVISIKLMVTPETDTKTQREITFELARRLAICLEKLEYIDAKFDIRYGYPGEPKFVPSPQ